MMDKTKGTSMGEAQPPLDRVDFDGLETGSGLDIFLLAGQSNMKGRATIEMEPEVNPNLFFFHSTQKQWFLARDPLHAKGTPDLIDGSDNSGTGPGLSFAEKVIESMPERKIGLIPSAVGGAPMDSFGSQGVNYLGSIELVKQAKEACSLPCRLKAILWLQGESDAQEEKHGDYEAKLLSLVKRYRADLKDPELPFLACTIGSFVNKGPFLFGREINENLLGLPRHHPKTVCIDARDLKDGHIGDQMHYDLPSQKEIGRRYAEAYLNMLNL